MLSRGDNCNAPCSTPSYPATFDTLHQQAVGWRRDRAGRDTARVDTRGIATTYQLDRLVRVLARRPWAVRASARDSPGYVLAGNVIPTVTRRGYVLTTSYDGRNRDTPAVTPTVGTVRTHYGVPPQKDPLVCCISAAHGPRQGGRLPLLLIPPPAPSAP